MRKLTQESNYAPFKHGYFMHILYILMPMAFYLAHSILEASYKKIEPSMTLMQLDFEPAIPYIPFFSIVFFLMVGILVFLTVFLMLTDVCAFKRFNIMLYIGLFLSILIAAGFPNYNTLLPDISHDDSFFGSLMKIITNFDSNTNNFPSIMAIGAAAILYSVFDSKKLNKTWLKIVSIVVAVLIVASSIFIKHNSIVDLIPSAIISSVLLIPLSLIKKKDGIKLGEEKIKRVVIDKYY